MSKAATSQAGDQNKTGMAETKVTEHNTTASSLNQYRDPDVEGLKRRLLSDLFKGPLNGSVKRKMRNFVSMKLREEHGEEYASNHYDFASQLIINVHLFTNHPSEFKALALDDVLIKKTKKDYPLQLQLLAEVSELINKGKTEKEIETALILK
jgi:hypothetical protein